MLRIASREQGTTLLGVSTAMAIVVLMVPTILGGIALSSWSLGESRALLQSATVAQSEIEWLQAYCSTKLNVLLEPATCDPGAQDCQCEKYQTDTWQSVPDKGVPGLEYKVAVRQLEGEAEIVETVESIVTVRWERVFLMDAPGQREYHGFLYGGNEEYWEFYNDWSLGGGD